MITRKSISIFLFVSDFSLFYKCIYKIITKHLYTFIWLLCGCYVAAMWLLCGCYVAAMWLLCGCYVAAM